MNDIFMEQLVSREKSSKDLVKKVGIILGAIILLAVVLVSGLGILLIPVLAIDVFAVIYLFKRLNAEYEYIITNDSLDIDIIYNKEKRKHLETIDVKSITIMANVNNKENERELSNYDTLKDYSSRVVKDNTYGMMIKSNKGNTKIIFEPNEKIFKAIKKYIPRKVK